MSWYDGFDHEEEYVIEVSLRFTAYVSGDTDSGKWVEEHKYEIIDAMRSKLDGRCSIVFEDNWGDLVDYTIYSWGE